MPSFYCIKFGLATSFVFLVAITCVFVAYWFLSEHQIKKLLRQKNR